MSLQISNRLVYLGDASSKSTTILLSEIADLGWRIHFISTERPVPGTILHPDIKYHRLPITATYPSTYAAFVLAAPLISSFKPSIIHACGLSSYGIMAAVHRRFLRFKPMVLTITGPDILTDAKGAMTRWSAEHALKMFEAVITVKDDALLGQLDRMNARTDLLNYLNTDDPKSAKNTAEQLDEIYTRLLGAGK